MKDTLKIIKSFGLEVEEIENNVYRILNTDKIVNIEKLQWELEDCIAIMSLKKGTERLENGQHTILANLYYIIIGTSNKELGYKYDDIATEEFCTSVYKTYKFNPHDEVWIGTIYRKDDTSL